MSPPSPKALALVALADAIEEAARPLIRQPVLAALLFVARVQLEAVAELQRIRKPRVAKEPGAA